MADDLLTGVNDVADYIGDAADALTNAQAIVLRIGVERAAERGEVEE